MPFIEERVVAPPGVCLEEFSLTLHFDSHLKDVSVVRLIVCIHLKFLGFLHHNSMKKHRSELLYIVEQLAFSNVPILQISEDFTSHKSLPYILLALSS